MLSAYEGKLNARCFSFEDINVCTTRPYRVQRTSAHQAINFLSICSGGKEFKFDLGFSTADKVGILLRHQLSSWIADLTGYRHVLSERK
ncbi:hypothetical protein Trydic_g6129 [Trypoxylus dichotomus]